MTERKHLSIVIDRYGNPWGPLEGHLKAVEWARKKWPDQHYADGGPNGWEIVALNSPVTE